MRIAICDDELIYRVAICEAIEHWQKQHGVEAVLVRHYHSSEELLNDIESKQRYDMLFLDIQIPNEMDLCQYFGQKKLKYYADFFSSSSSLCCGVI